MCQHERVNDSVTEDHRSLMNTQVKVQKVHYVHTKTGKRVSFVDANNIINNSCFYQY